MSSPVPVRSIVSSTPSSTPDVVSSRRTTVTDDSNITLNDSFDIQNSFEDTLQDQDHWSSFEDVQDDDDVSYV